MSVEAPYFGIDFGTTNSSMAWYDPKTGRAEIILNDHGEEKTPSIVYFGEEEVLVGKDAVNVLEEFSNSSDPEERDDANRRVVRSIKRNLLNPPVIPIPGREPVLPVEVVAKILGRLKSDAEEGHFYEEIERAVITCPAIFGPREQEVLLKAATMVGFRRVELLEEPTSAAIAFTRLGQKVGKGVLVYDLGAGTFDLSVVVRDGVGSEDAFYVPMEPQGDPKCGGDDLDQTLYDYCDRIAQKELGRFISLTNDVDLFFLRHCRSRKENLSKAKKSKFASLLASEDGRTISFRYEMDQETYEALIQDRIEGTVRKTARLWEQARSKGHEVDTVVMIGGSSRVPLVERLLKEALPVEPRKFAGRDYAVALGAAYHAHDLWGTKAIPAPDKKTEEYRRVLKICWQDRKLTQTEVEWLRSLAKQELELDPDTAARIEREEMGDTIDGILESREPVAREYYRRVLQLGWKDRKLDALRHVPRARLDMLLNNRELFTDFDFPDAPVSAASRKELLGDTPWAVFTMAARVAADPTLTPAAVAERLSGLADELGLSTDSAVEVEREVLGNIAKRFLELQTDRRSSRDEYHKAVERAGAGGQMINRHAIDEFGTLANDLGLDAREAVDIEQQVLGGTVAAVVMEQDEARALLQEHGLIRSQIKGTGIGGRVTKRDVEAHVKQVRDQRERAEREQEHRSSGEAEIIRQLNELLDVDPPF